MAFVIVGECIFKGVYTVIIAQQGSFVKPFFCFAYVVIGSTKASDSHLGHHEVGHGDLLVDSIDEIFERIFIIVLSLIEQKYTVEECYLIISKLLCLLFPIPGFDIVLFGTLTIQITLDDIPHGFFMILLRGNHIEVEGFLVVHTNAINTAFVNLSCPGSCLTMLIVGG